MKQRLGRKALVMCAAVLAATVGGLGLAGQAQALSKDGTNPSGCSSPQTVRTASILRSGVVIGRTELRFSDPCDIVWSRVCWDSYSFHTLSVTRTIPDGYYGGFALGGSSGSGVCSGSYSQSKYGAGVEDDCQEDYGYTCAAYGSGALADASSSYWGQTTTF